MDTDREATHEETASSAAPWQVSSPLRPGQLTGGWRTVFIVGWVGVMAGFGSVAQGGRLAGISPWWIGPETDPRNPVIFALPFVAPIIAIVAAVRGSRYAWQVGLAAAVASAAVALGDLAFPGLALVELIVAGAGLGITIACFAGRAVKPPASPEPDQLR